MLKEASDCLRNSRDRSLHESDDDTAEARAGRRSRTRSSGQIHDAVIEQRLPPGTKLSEAALCEAFGVGRAKVRRASGVAGREIVELHANRGAFVARPTAQEARDVFDARRTIEPGIVRQAAARARERTCACSRSTWRRRRLPRGTATAGT